MLLSGGAGYNVVVVDNLSNSWVTVFERVEKITDKIYILFMLILEVKKALGGIFEMTKI